MVSLGWILQNPLPVTLGIMNSGCKRYGQRDNGCLVKVNLAANWHELDRKRCAESNIVGPKRKTVPILGAKNKEGRLLKPRKEETTFKHLNFTEPTPGKLISRLAHVNA